jgi:hypothetical protein
MPHALELALMSLGDGGLLLTLVLSSRWAMVPWFTLYVFGALVKRLTLDWYEVPISLWVEPVLVALRCLTVWEACQLIAEYLPRRETWHLRFLVGAMFVAGCASVIGPLATPLEWYATARTAVHTGLALGIGFSCLYLWTAPIPDLPRWIVAHAIILTLYLSAYAGFAAWRPAPADLASWLAVRVPFILTLLICCLLWIALHLADRRFHRVYPFSR